MDHTNEQPGFWEAAFSGKQEMWGMAPAPSAVMTRDYFVQLGLKQVLIPGIGYGRNAQPFKDSGMTVTGIEISPTAIALARKHYGMDMTIYQGSVTDMPFDDRVYDGIFCYALIHLLDSAERAKLISDCFNQLADGGCMVFVAISKKAPTYGQGAQVAEDRFEQFGGVRLFFYDDASVQAEFGAAGLTDLKEVEENYPFYVITCRKRA